MDIRIGIKDSAREIAFDSAQSAQEIEAAVVAALGAGTGLLAVPFVEGLTP